MGMKIGLTYDIVTIVLVSLQTLDGFSSCIHFLGLPVRVHIQVVI